MGQAKYLYYHYKDLGSQEHDFRNNNLNMLVSRFVKGIRVLDIGCGAGILLAAIKKQGKEVYGIEPNKALIALGKKLHPKISVMQGYAEDITKIKQQFDTITMIDVLEHVNNDTLVLEKVYDKLNDGGRLILVVPAYQFLYGKRDESNGHYRRYGNSELRKKLQDAGLRIVSMRTWNMLGFFPYVISEKLFGRALQTSLRTKQQGAKSLAHGLLHRWFMHVENRVSFGFGLSIICIAQKGGSR